jgi:hypothetical protein
LALFDIWTYEFNYFPHSGKSERKRPLRISRRRWEDNIRMDLREVGWEGMDWIHLFQERDQQWALVNTVMKHRVP